jgi:hypothetical protein
MLQLLVSFSAGLAALLVRNDPHRLVTRLLSKVRLLATFAAVLALAAAVVLAFGRPQAAHDWLLVLFIASIIPTAFISLSWLLVLRRSLRNDPQESPWEHHRPRKSKSTSQDPEQAAQLGDETVTFAPPQCGTGPQRDVLAMSGKDLGVSDAASTR